MLRINCKNINETGETGKMLDCFERKKRKPGENEEKRKNGPG